MLLDSWRDDEGPTHKWETFCAHDVASYLPPTLGHLPTKWVKKDAGNLTKLLRNARNDGVFRTDLRGSAALLDTLGGVGGGGRGGDDVAHNLVVRGLGVLDLDGLVVPQAVAI